nr:TonB-dependent receptor [Sphingomonas bacterium]
MVSVLCAAPAAAQTAAGEPARSDEIVVSGRRVSQAQQAIGEDRITNTVAVTREALLSAPSGISGLKMLEALPGFNVQTDGALGLYEFGNSVQTRAFNLDQIGFVVDGIPTGRSDVFGGSPVFRYVDNENLGSVRASVGAGDVSLPSYSSLGPVVEYDSILPQHELGIFASQTFGDYHLRRTFVRVSTGDIGPIRAFVSRTKLKSNLWRGTGTVDREHWEAMLHADLGGDSWARLKFVSNDFKDYDSPTLSRAQANCTPAVASTFDAVGRCGSAYGYAGDLPALLQKYPQVVAGLPYSNDGLINYYGLAINIRNDRLYGGTLHLGIADNVWDEVVPYWEHKAGSGVSADSYSNSNARYLAERAVGLPVNAPRGTQYGRSGVGGDRYGIVNTLHWQVGAQTLTAGIWAEVDKYHRTQARYNTTDGSPASPPDFSSLVFLRRDYRSKHDTTQLFLKDSAQIIPDKLILDVGIKGLALDYRQSGYRDYADYYRVVGGVPVAGYGPKTNSAHYQDLFLPMAGLLYKFDRRTQAFLSYAENLALPKGMDDIFSVALSGSPALVPAPKPERSKNLEIGIRTNQQEFYGSLALYYTRFANRIASNSAPLAGSTVLETFYQNVGRVRAYGAEFTGTYKPRFLRGLAYANLNATYNNAKFQDDFTAGTTLIATRGKYLPDSAKWVVSGGLTVEPASWLVANLSGKYTSRRWSTLRNDPGSDVPGFTIFSAYVDIGDGFTVGPLKNVRVRANLDNVFNAHALSFISASTTGDGFFRPQQPRTFQVTFSVGI